MNKQPEITDATRNNFIDAFFELYRKRPVEQISVKELVRQAGYSRATFYNYFRDIYDLLDYVEDDFITSVMESVAGNIRSGRELENFIPTFMELLQRKSIYIDVFTLSSNSPRFMDKIYAKALPVLIDEFGVSKNDLQAVYALRFYIAGLFPTIAEWLRNNRDLPMESLAALIKGILLDGIFAQLQKRQYKREPL